MFYKQFKFAKKYWKLFVCSLCLIFIICCGIIINNLYNFNNKSDKIYYLPENFYWAECKTQNEEFSDSLNFTKITEFKRGNLPDNSKKNEDGSFIWVKIPFEIPEKLKNKDLGLTIPYIHFSEKAWLNGEFVGEYGKFPPHQISAQNQSHFYLLSEENLFQDKTNNLILKVYVQGHGSISNKIFISEAEHALQISKDFTFLNSTIYIAFIGGMFATLIIFFSLYLFNPNQKKYFHFVMINFFSMWYIFSFFASDLPIYTSLGISHLNFVKFFNCLCGFGSTFFSASFLISYFNIKEKREIFILRIIILFTQIIILSFVNSYKDLLTFIIPFFLMDILSLSYGIYFLIRQLISKQNRKSAAILILSLIPTLSAIIFDLINKVINKNLFGQYLTVFGWQISIILFLMILAYKYVKTNLDVVQIKQNLELEVKKQTENLEEINKKLEEKNQQIKTEKSKTDNELHLARTIQENFLQKKDAEFLGWQIGILYKPHNEVSGDIYDYYETEGKLNSLSIFDISGHGISSGMISIMAINIIKRNITRGFAVGFTPSKILANISKEIADEKGNIENYLTGITLTIDNFTKTDECKIHLANGGHPYPILYRASQEKAEQIKPEKIENQFGAIGIKDFEVSFPDCDFDMAIDDILVLFTDGVTEPEDAKKNQFGIYRLKAEIKENAEKTPTEIANAINESLENYLGEIKTTDDITIIVMKRCPTADFIEELN